MGYLDDKKITNDERDSVKVQAQPDTLAGTTTENKAIFDKFPELIRTKFNALIDAIGTKQDSTDTSVTGKADKATTLSGYGITDSYTKTEEDNLLAGKANKGVTLSDYNIGDAYTKTAVDTAVNKKADKATTVAGYGITDAYDKTNIDSRFAAKQDKLAFDTAPAASSTNPVTSKGIYDAIAKKQDIVTIDTVPTDGSLNLVTSNGVYKSIATKQDKLTYDTTPTSGSSNSVTSGTVRDAISTTDSKIVGKSGAGKSSEIHSYDSNTIANGDYSFAAGDGARAVGISSFASGMGSTATGSYSFAAGSYGHSDGYNSFAFGDQVSAGGRHQVVFGQNNIVDNTSAFIIGNGEAANARSNAFMIDTDGNVKCKTVKGLDGSTLYQNKTVAVALTLSAATWANKQYSFESTYPFASYDIEIEPAGTITKDQLTAWQSANIVGSIDSNVITAIGTVPNIDIPVIAKVVAK